MSRGKTNPRRIPVTQADIKRARKKAEEETLDMACAIILMGLLDGGIIQPEQMRTAWDAIAFFIKEVAFSAQECRATGT